MTQQTTANGAGTRPDFMAEALEQAASAAARDEVPIGAVLVVVQIERAADHSVQWGIWSALAGSVLCIVAGLTPTRTVVTTFED